MSAPSPDIDPLVKQFQSLQEQTQALVMGRQNFLSRLNENKMVQEELERLNDDSNVFKLIGPVLVKQDVDDAKATVASRLELIERELERIGAEIEQKEKDQMSTRQMIMQVQQAAQAAKAAGGGGAPGGASYASAAAGSES